MAKIINVVNASKSFNSLEKALNNVSLDIEQGLFYVLLGQSGSGKSTLISIMSSLLKPTSGKVFYKEQDITNFSQKDKLKLRRESFSNIFQEYYLLSELTVRENIELGRPLSDKCFSYKEILEKLDILALENRFPYELSGGQRQRVSIARAIIKNPEILFCDEATGALDEENSKSVVSFLKDINRDFKTTIVFSTHNVKIAKLADRVVTLKDGMILKEFHNPRPSLVHDIDWGIGE